MGAIAVGGAFLKGHVIVVGTLESDVLTVDGRPVLGTLNSHYKLADDAILTYDAEGELVDSAAGIWSKHVVHMRLPLDVHITVFRWKNYLDLRIRMPRQPG